MKEHQGKAFLTNFGLKVFHTLGDAETGEFACSLLGRARESFATFQQKPDLTLGEELFGHAGMTGSFNESHQNVLQSSELLTGLRCGGPPDYCADAYVIRSGRPFSTGRNWLKVAFSQR